MVAKALYDFRNVRDKKGKLRKLGRKFRRDLSCAVNDDDLHYEGVTDADKKANVLRRIATTYHNVVFVDDDDKNLHGVLGLNMPNIVVVKTFSK